MSTAAWIAIAVISAIWLVVIVAIIKAAKNTDAKDNSLHKAPKKDSDE